MAKNDKIHLVNSNLVQLLRGMNYDIDVIYIRKLEIDHYFSLYLDISPTKGGTNDDK